MVELRSQSKPPCPNLEREKREKNSKSQLRSAHPEQKSTAGDFWGDMTSNSNSNVFLEAECTLTWEWGTPGATRVLYWATKKISLWLLWGRVMVNIVKCLYPQEKIYTVLYLTWRKGISLTLPLCSLLSLLLYADINKQLNQYIHGREERWSIIPHCL